KAAQSIKGNQTSARFRGQSGYGGIVLRIGHHFALQGCVFLKNSFWTFYWGVDPRYLQLSVNRRYDKSMGTLLRHAPVAPAPLVEEFTGLSPWDVCRRLAALPYLVFLDSA